MEGCWGLIIRRFKNRVIASRAQNVEGHDVELHGEHRSVHFPSQISGASVDWEIGPCIMDCKLLASENCMVLESILNMVVALVLSGSFLIICLWYEPSISIIFSVL